MGKKICENATKIYKPEILTCPFCNSKLKYKYTVSNKVVQFTSGKYFRIKNLGYGCPNCNDIVYFSQTANKLCFKGCTYSAKIVCTIDYYKSLHKGREEICDILVSKGIEISDRNVDVLYEKFLKYYNQDYDSLINESFSNMQRMFNEVRISIDLITINQVYYVIIYDYFTSNKLAIWKFNSFDEMRSMFKRYLTNDFNITYIVTIRNIKNNKMLSIIREFVPKVKMIAFNKF